MQRYQNTKIKVSIEKAANKIKIQRKTPWETEIDKSLYNFKRGNTYTKITDFKYSVNMTYY